MPISHQHKVIFVHIPRTAGSSIENVLGICGDDNQGTLTPPRPDMLYGLVGNKVMQHYTWKQIRDRVGGDIYDQYFKFAFVRNPFDRVVSQYHVRKRLFRNFKISFKDFVFKKVAKRNQFSLMNIFKSRGEKALEDQFENQWEFIFDPREKLMVDYVGRYETLKADYAAIGTKLNLVAPLPEMNQSAHENYQKYFDHETRDLVERLYKKDLELFNYSF